MILIKNSNDSIKLALPYQTRCTSMRKLGRRYELQLMNCPIAYVSQLMLQNYQRIKKKMMNDDIKQRIPKKCDVKHIKYINNYMKCYLSNNNHWWSIFIYFEFHLFSSFLTLKASVNALIFYSYWKAIIKRDSSIWFYDTVVYVTFSVSTCILARNTVLCNLSELNEVLFL